MTQGDSYPIFISSSGLDLQSVTKIEFTVGPYAKEYPGTVTYDSTNSVFSFPVSQQETLRLVGVQPCEAKIKYNNGEVEVCRMGSIAVDPAISKAVI